MNLKEKYHKVLAMRARLRNYKNKAENAFVETCLAEGWAPSKRGWPDFICFKGNEIRAVEVKPQSSNTLKIDQAVVCKILAKAGIKTYRWNPTSGFTEITGEEMDSELSSSIMKASPR